MLFYENDDEIYIFILSYSNGLPIKTAYYKPNGGSSITEHSGFIQRNSMESYHVFFRKTANNLAFSRFSLTNDPFTIEDLQPFAPKADNYLVIKPASVYYDSTSSTLALFATL